VTWKKSIEETICYSNDSERSHRRAAQIFVGQWVSGAKYCDESVCLSVFVWPMSGCGDCDESRWFGGDSVEIFEWMLDKARTRSTRDKCRSRCLNFAKYSPVCSSFYWHFFFIVITDYTALRVQHVAYVNTETPVYLYSYSIGLYNIYMTNSKNMHLTKRRRVWIMDMEDFWVMWIWGFCGIPTGFSVGMGWVWGLKSIACSPATSRARPVYSKVQTQNANLKLA